VTGKNAPARLPPLERQDREAVRAQRAEATMTRVAAMKRSWRRRRKPKPAERQLTFFGDFGETQS